MTTAQVLILVAIAIYLLFMLWIGWICAKKNESVDDFYLGGRKLGPFVTAMSAEASDMSSWLLMGLPGVAYLTGLAEASWTAIGLVVGTYLNWLIVAKRIRRYSNRLNAITVPQFFSKRWGDHRSLLSAVAAVVIIIFFIPYTASGFSACGKLFSTLFGMDYLTAMLISAAVIVIYTVMGGFLAATMSTADSQLLAASSSVSQDLGNDFLKCNFSGKRGMIVARGVMLAISAIAAFLARDPDSSVFRVVSFAWAGFGAAFGPVMLMVLFWKRSNKWGALAGMLVGGIMVFVWKFLIAPLGGVWAIYELLPAFLCSLVAIVVVSLLTPAPEKSVVQVFEEVRQK